MRIAVTADLHYGMRPAWDAAVRTLAERIIEREPDVIIIAGDVAVADPRILVECLLLFSDSPAHKLVVPGNHDLWCSEAKGGADSLTIWERLFTESARLGGFHRLDRSPCVLDGIGFVGSVGWYDYSFADKSLDVPYEWYLKKTMPGVARWNDVRFIRWKYDDVSFTELLLDELGRHLADVRDRSACIVAAIHHIPFVELLTRHAHRGWRFHNAFMGAHRFGQMLLAEPKLCLCVCGHSHQGRSMGIGQIHAVNIGTTYTKKRALFYEVGPQGVSQREVVEVQRGA